ncbi:hypothetical protein HMPREF9374_2568 [Desmospora sp. 8437]|uniref:Uncharacterized protein n=1 Tax=Kroppenstedtia guangzhouensis TaxID=1274356 RepID=A0ABQ1GNP6_9BACL|nr:hypothetical protein [Kroppenstedtia guangzhouensis]EGK10218.1 hypothetical protein HMPREF9374_2568 [Desmospora sp. 8437]GGA47041.1 hypothetical protein GCM10007416_20280 [Kroppenstedtia guangzhouensis]
MVIWNNGIVTVPEAPSQVINETVPFEIRSNFVPIVRKGYQYTDELIRTNKMLNWSIGRQQRGDLLNVGVAFAFKEIIEQGKLPLDFKLDHNKPRTFQYFLLCTNTVTITVSQVQSSTKVPRKADFRDDLYEYGQGRLDLFDEDLGVNINQDRVLLLTHGYQRSEPHFVNLGIPGKKNWIYRIELIDELERSAVEQVPEEEITEEEMIRFKEFSKEIGS